MARLIYIALGCALAALVVGFVVRTSNVPLLVSCGFSVVALVLMFRGWSKRLRETGGIFDEPGSEQPLEELDVTSVDAEPVDVEPAVVEEAAAVTAAVAGKLRPETRRASKRRPKLEPIEIPDAVDVPPTVTAVATPKPKPQPKAAAAKQKPSAPKPAAPTRRVAAHVFVIPGRSRYHAAGCRFAKGGDVREVTEATAKRRGYVACSVCMQSV